jgi:hypothetical protein
MKRAIGLEKVLYEDYEKKPSYGSMWEGDFDSDASKQSWSEFWKIYYTMGPITAVARELSTWHGEREIKKYPSPVQVYLGELAIPENWKTYEIGSGTDASSFIDGVETDELGDYITYNSPEGNLKFYLPNKTWFNQFSGTIYKFETDTGEVYSLFLSLDSQKSEVSLSLGADDSIDNLTISLKNLNPENGNGWMFEMPENFNKGDREYFKKISENLIVPFNPFAYEDSIKSSWQLFWEKWGVVIQIVLSVILAELTGGLSAEIQLLFAEGGLMARLSPTVSAEVLGWLTSTGSFSVVRSEVLALFLLETAVNLPAAFIDKSFNNDFGFVLGIAFCFFPFVSTYGRLGKWIKGSYSKEASQQLATKVLNKGFNEFTSQEIIYKFITEELTAEEKLMFSEGMKLLGNKEGAEAFKQTLKEAMQNGAKNKEFPSMFKQFMSGSKWGETLKTLVAASVYFIDVSKWYFILKAKPEFNKDGRPVDEIILDAQKNINEIDKKFVKTNQKDLELSSTNNIIGSYITSLPEDEAAKLIFSLSKKNNENDKFFQDLVALKKMEELQKNSVEWAKNDKITDQKLTKILEAFSELNSYSKTPKTKEEIYQLFNPVNLDVETTDFFAKYDKDPMINQLKQTTQKYPCLITNFDYIDGWPYSDTEWTLNYKVKAPITIKYNSGSLLNLKVGDEMWLYWPEGNFRIADKEYNLFSC